MSIKLNSDCSSERFDSKMTLKWNDTFWFVDHMNRKKSNARSFVCARKLFIGGINSKKVFDFLLAMQSLRFNPIELRLFSFVRLVSAVGHI